MRGTAIKLVRLMGTRNRQSQWGGLIPANHGALPVRCWSESLAQGGPLGAGVETAELLTGEPACFGICNHLPLDGPELIVFGPQINSTSPTLGMRAGM